MSCFLLYSYTNILPYVLSLTQEMDSAGTPDESMKPVVLFGADTAQLGAVTGAYPEAWRHQQAGRALHVVMEGCEPSTGLR